MKASMSMNLDTTWGNAIALTVEAELDNAHDLTTGELTRLQVWVLSLMVAEVRALNERALENRDSAAVTAEPFEPSPIHGERKLFAEMERSRGQDERERVQEE